jgi:citrate lyase subunit beta/citryl-CoA lyase
VKDSLRSWLVTPTTDEKAVHEAARAGADVAVADLVEFVREEDGELARMRLSPTVAELRPGSRKLFVQMDVSSFERDLPLAVATEADGVVLLDIATPEQVEAVDQLVVDLRGSRPGFELVLAIETARANWAAHELSLASPLVSYLTLGRADLKMDLRPDLTDEFHLMPFLMQRLILIARATGRRALGAWWRPPDRGLLADAERTHDAAVRGQAIGFSGALCIEPVQVDGINRAFAQ